MPSHMTNFIKFGISLWLIRSMCVCVCVFLSQVSWAILDAVNGIASVVRVCFYFRFDFVLISFFFFFSSSSSLPFVPPPTLKLVPDTFWDINVDVCNFVSVIGKKKIRWKTNRSIHCFYFMHQTLFLFKQIF